MIVAAAVKASNGLVAFLPSPARHCDIVEEVVRLTKGTDAALNAERGFITNMGEFLDRQAAADLALASGQVDRLRIPPYLYTDDVW